MGADRHGGRDRALPQRDRQADGHERPRALPVLRRPRRADHRADQDAYSSLADTLRTAAESGADLTALAHALREWALADPHRYFLIYGTPVPGYQAPDDVTGIAQGIMATLLDACAVLPSDGPATPFDTHLESHRQWAAGHPAPPAALHRGLALWTRLHGVLSLELAGHFNGMGFDPALLYAAELDDLLSR